MARYLVIYTPDPTKEEDVNPPANLVGLARASIESNRGPRWLRSWSPDLHDDRIFTLWEADEAADITRMMSRFGFLHDGSVVPIRVREWDPEDVLAAESDS
jgi:hypothetical protein